MNQTEQSPRPIAVFGAAGAVGEAIARTLIRQGYTVLPVSRRPHAVASDLGESVSADLNDPASLAAAVSGASTVILTPVITLSVNALPALQAAGVDRAVFVSSQNVTVGAAQKSYAALHTAERAVHECGLRWTILRPTLIYGDPRLATITRLIHLARKWPILPSPGLGLAHQQPVFHEDLASVAAWCAHAPEALGKTIAVGGPQIMRLNALYAAVSRAAGGTGLVAPVPFWVLHRIKHALGERFPLSDDQLSRARADKHINDVFDFPPSVRPSTSLDQGLKRHVAALDQIAAHALSSQARSAP
jgi:NADH dehydrogenase